MLLKVGELAKHAGLTVRTLHHYDEIGLLKPSGRSESGYRLYSREDVARLHGIQALRQLGLALADIGAMLEKGGTPPGLIIDQQMRALDREIARATELRDHLGLLQHQLAKGNEPGMADWLDTLGLMKTYGKYFSAAELKTIFANWNLIENDWEPLVAAVREVMNQGFAADAPEVQPLAQRWMRLMLRWMDGNFDLIDRWGEMYEKEPSAAGRNGAPQSDMIEFIRRAIDLRMALLCKYLTLAEIRRFRHIPDEEWQAMACRVKELMDRGVAPGSDPAQAMVGQWLALLDRLVGDDQAVRARLLLAQASEPLLQAGSTLPAPARAYLRQCMAQGLTLT
ncbi:MerR family transcriptional regulator [Ramlibacter sp. WS9]|uniref:MerR family transcriptional regulator n=1 Tax=Ramlibacter sp. WS9 TaxID=1882741 RepID=UPI001143FDE0|nr:MerR family transcriptional regulator [Ramlibacter sp. WS9]ROZ79605.1 MerR family transcriptional regulator [Ramlibacter sp. WS9]